MERYAISGATWAAWKSIECCIVPLLTNVTFTVCPCRTCRIGPGTVPPNVHAWYCTPLAISIVASFDSMVTATTLPFPMSGGSTGEKTCATGAPEATLSGDTAAAAFCGVGGKAVLALPSVDSAKTRMTMIPPITPSCWSQLSAGGGRMELFGAHSTSDAHFG